MSEEEKKAIDFLKNDVIYWLDKGKDFVVIDIGYNEKLHCILNLIEKQQKEIEELENKSKRQFDILCKYEDELEIYEDKVLKLIKDINDETRYFGKDRGESKQEYAVRKIKELLEEIK